MTINLAQAAQHLHPSADPGPGGNFSVRDDLDGRGPYIERWDAEVIGAPQPTQEELEAAWPEFLSASQSEAIRAMQRPLLEEADWRLARAEDNGDNDLVSAIRSYRTAVRAVGDQVDLSNPTWPTKPWS